MTKIDRENIIKKFNVLESVAVTRASGKKDIHYITPCAKCNVSNKLTTTQIRRADKIRGYYLCDKCANNGDNKILRICSLNKRKSNTTGFIGVCVKQYQGKIFGYVARINYRGKCLLRNKYRDKYLHKSTLMQAAVDRDIFIIEHDLPHKRNFNDNELLGNMSYLAHHQLEEFRDKVKSGAISNYTTTL